MLPGSTGSCRARKCRVCGHRLRPMEDDARILEEVFAYDEQLQTALDRAGDEGFFQYFRHARWLRCLGQMGIENVTVVILSPQVTRLARLYSLQII